MFPIVITGVAGFLGSHLARHLLNSGHVVIGYDNFSSGSRSNVTDLIQWSTFTFHEEDVTQRAWLASADVECVREIYHLASPAAPPFYQSDPFGTIAVNTIGTQNVLDLAMRTQARVVYTSTSEAYGDPEVHPQPETYRGSVNTWGPRACYDESKRLGEVFCYEYFTRYGVSVKVARLFNTYSAGLRNDDGRVISNFVTQALAGQDITVYGDGSQTRSFCYVDDTVNGLVRLMACDAAIGEILNLGTEEEYAILDVARMVKRLSDSASDISFLPLPKDDPKVRRPVLDKARHLLGWAPQVTLEEGLGRTIATYRARLSQSVV